MMSAVGNVAALLIDSQDFFRSSLKDALISVGLFEQVFEARSLQDAAEILNLNSNVQFISADISNDINTSVSDFKSIRFEFPGVRLAVISWPKSRNHILASLEAGAHGYIPKTFQMHEILDSIGHILAGKVFVPAAIVNLDEAPVHDISYWTAGEERPQVQPNSTRQVSTREIEVLQLLAQGKSNKEIAKCLKLAEGTVKVHVNSAYRALGAHNRIGAVLAFSRLQSKSAGAR